MLQAYISLDGVRAIFVLLFALMQIFIGTRIDNKRRVHRDAVHGKNLDTPLIPYGPFFAIWIVIFAGCLAFAIWQVMPQNLADPYLRQVGWVAATIFIGASAWQVWVPKKSMGMVSLAIILVTFLHGLLALRVIVQGQAPQSGVAFWAGVAPLLITAGWLSLVAFANLSSTLVMTQSRFNPRSVPVASSLILLAGFVVASFGFYSGSYLYIGAAIWGLLGIIVGTIVKKQSHRISGAAGLSIMMIIAATGLSY